MGPPEGERLQGSCYAAILAGMDADRFHELGALFERAIALDRAGGRGLLDDLKTRDRKLGEGGMGVVYPGHRKTADFEQLLAIKRRPISAGPTAASSRPG